MSLLIQWASNEILMKVLEIETPIYVEKICTNNNENFHFFKAKVGYSSMEKLYTYNNEDMMHTVGLDKNLAKNFNRVKEKKSARTIKLQMRAILMPHRNCTLPINSQVVSMAAPRQAWWVFSVRAICGIPATKFAFYNLFPEDSVPYIAKVVSCVPSKYPIITTMQGRNSPPTKNRQVQPPTLACSLVDPPYFVFPTGWKTKPPAALVGNKFMLAKTPLLKMIFCRSTSL